MRVSATTLGRMETGHSEIVILIKAAPQAGQRHGETVCCAGVDAYGQWHRLYPVSFRTLDEGQRFGRWHRVAFVWRSPRDDQRPESRRVDQGSLRILGSVKKSDRSLLLSRLTVASLSAERDQGRSLALLKPQNPSFFFERKEEHEIERERSHLSAAVAQADLFNAGHLVPYEPCPYRFRYRYTIAEGKRTGTCQDWEIEATFFKWRLLYGEHKALTEMVHVFGDEYPRKGMLFAMGTHSQYPDTWLINGVIRYDETGQPNLL